VLAQGAEERIHAGWVIDVASLIWERESGRRTRTQMMLATGSVLAQGAEERIHAGWVIDVASLIWERVTRRRSGGWLAALLCERLWAAMSEG
jgi:urease accessory protein UreF